jgi:uncharacterized protein (DUF1501 family)
MKRRSFLKYTSLATAGAMFPFRGFSVNPAVRLPFLAQLAAGGNPQGRVLVLIYLNGGNDGLHTLVPLDQYEQLQDARPNIVLPENSILPLNGAPANGLHPAMTQLRKLFNDGKVSIVQNVGYPNQDYSHFRSTDIWMTGADHNEHLETGWLGRYLQGEYPDYPTGYPNAAMPDPLAIEIGAVSSLTVMGPTQPLGMAVSDPAAFYQFVNDLVEPAPDTPYGHELEYIRLISQQAQVYYQVVKDAAENGQNLSNLYPASGNALADQLKIVAQLISGGLQTPIYIVTLGGFDTHSEQMDPNGGPTTGAHANLLGMLSQAIGAFQDDLELLGVDDRVAGMTFSEFGRTINSNASYGTDHGAAAPLFVFGSSVIPGIIGANPVLPDPIFGSADLPMAYDFRSVYASALQDWFGLANPETVLSDPYPILPIFQAPSSGTHTAVAPAQLDVACTPNPFRTQTTIRFTSSGGRVRVAVLDLNGRVLEVVKEAIYPEGTFEVPLERGALPGGTYFYQVQVNRTVVTKKLMVL